MASCFGPSSIVSPRTTDDTAPAHEHTWAERKDKNMSRVPLRSIFVLIGVGGTATIIAGSSACIVDEIRRAQW